MQRSTQQRRDDAMRIWHAGVEAVRSDRLVREAMRVEGRLLLIGEQEIDLAQLQRIAVVGAGKAGAGMAAAVEEILGSVLIEQKRLSGWVNVPADCVRPLRKIVLHPGRPAGVNEPTPAGAAGTDEILRLVESLGPHDLCLCLLSGGASALMPAPAAGIALEDKLAVTRFLSAAGATIDELNTVRKQLSRIKGGGLARHCHAGRLVCLIISDVLGDPLDVIGSGPTVADLATPQAALEVLKKFDGIAAGIAPKVVDYLRGKPAAETTAATCASENFVINLVIGNNATAVDAAGEEAVRLGYSPAMTSARHSEGAAEIVGRHLADMALLMRTGGGPDCLISGGEPVVTLVETGRRGLGGRNQQLVLAAAQRLLQADAGGITMLSGGTDGEDGPTDAAGALVDDEILAAAERAGLVAGDYLGRNDAYHFFEPLDALIKTGPTHTNVCDVRVVLVSRSPSLAER